MTNAWWTPKSGSDLKKRIVMRRATSRASDPFDYRGQKKDPKRKPSLPKLKCLKDEKSMP